MVQKEELYSSVSFFPAREKEKKKEEIRPARIFKGREGKIRDPVNAEIKGGKGNSWAVHPRCEESKGEKKSYALPLITVQAKRRRNHQRPSGPHRGCIWGTGEQGEPASILLFAQREKGGKGGG